MTPEDIKQLFELPFNELLYRAHTIHRENHDPNAVQLATLCNIKKGACPEDCKYCSQSGHHRKVDIDKYTLVDPEEVIEQARRAKAEGATRFCMAGAWRSPPKKDMPKLAEMIKEIKNLGLETCGSFGLLSKEQTEALEEAGLEYYNHNLDTSRTYYDEIITTRSYDDRLTTLDHVANSSMKICCGGILGLGETRKDRIEFLAELTNLPEQPESVPINQLVRIEGTPLGEREPIETLEFIRTIAVARICLPKARIRLSAGRSEMDDSTQALAFFAGANSMFYGDELLTTENPACARDRALMNELGLHATA